MWNPKAISIEEFRSGHLVLRCGDDWSTDLEFVRIESDNEEMVLEQREVLEYLMRAVRAYRGDKKAEEVVLSTRSAKSVKVQKGR